MLKKFKQTAEKEKYFGAVEQEFNVLRDKMVRDKKADIEKSREEISELLADEIVTRYYYQRGGIENSFRYDPEVRRAVEILSNPSFYQDVITGKYVEEVKKKGK